MPSNLDQDRLGESRDDEAPRDPVRVRAEANLRKEERARDGALAMNEYQANGRVVRDRMAELRALRLAKEAADKQNAVNGLKAAATSAATARKRKTAPAKVKTAPAKVKSATAKVKSAP